MKQAGKCTPKIKNTCGSTTYSTCVVFQGNPNETSPLADESCLDQEIVTQDIYDQLGEIIEDISTEGLGDKCLTYPEDPNVNQVLIVFEEEICDLKEEIEALKNTDLCNKSIVGCDLDLACLVESCDCEINTFGELQQAIINKVCETESETVVQNNFVRQLVISENDLPEDYTEQDICDYILNLPDEERTILETDSKWNVLIEDKKVYEIQNTGKGLINTLSPDNLLLIRTDDLAPNLQKVITYPADFVGTNYTLTNEDNGYTIFVNNDATAVTINLNASIAIPNFEVGFIQEGTGLVTLLPTGVALTNPIGLKIKGQGYQAFIERKLNTSIFYLLGNTQS